MYICKVMGDYGFALEEKELSKRQVWVNGLDNPPHIQCVTDNGVICLVPLELWEEADSEDINA